MTDQLLFISSVLSLQSFSSVLLLLRLQRQVRTSDTRLTFCQFWTTFRYKTQQQRGGGMRDENDDGGVRMRDGVMRMVMEG